jgi:LPXTG-motif cell wall-anchored protein
MKFTVSSSALLSVLSMTGKVINNKSSLPILEHFLMELKDGVLRVTASDSETTLIGTLEVENVEAEGMVAAPAKVLLDVLKECSEMPLTFDVNENTWEIKITWHSGGSSVPGANPVSYPTNKTLAEDKTEVTMDVDTLVNGINKTIFAKDDAGEYWMLKNGLYTTEAPVLEEYTVENIVYKPNAYLYDSTTQKYAKIHTVTKDTTDIADITAEGYVGENGVITFTGLGVGTYTITEIVAPDGYNLLTAPVVVEVKFDDVNKVFTATVDSEEAAVVDGVIAFDVINNAGTVLPGTGGIGTTIFYVVGGILLVAAAVLLITKKFANANK